MNMNKIMKIILLILIDAATMFAAYFGVDKIFVIADMAHSDIFMKFVPIFVAAKIVIYIVTGLYKEETRGMIFEVIAIFIANIIVFLFSFFYLGVKNCIPLQLIALSLDLIIETLSRSFLLSVPDEELEKLKDYHDELISNPYDTNTASLYEDNYDDNIDSNIDNNYDDNYNDEYDNDYQEYAYENENNNDIDNYEEEPYYEDANDDIYSLTAQELSQRDNEIYEMFQNEQKQTIDKLRQIEQQLKNRELELQEKENNLDSYTYIQNDEEPYYDEYEENYEEVTAQPYYEDSYPNEEITNNTELPYENEIEPNINSANYISPLEIKREQKREEYDQLEKMLEEMKTLHIELETKAKEMEKQEALFDLDIKSMPSRENNFDYTKQKRKLSDKELIEATENKLMHKRKRTNPYINLFPKKEITKERTLKDALTTSPLLKDLNSKEESKKESKVDFLIELNERLEESKKRKENNNK